MEDAAVNTAMTRRDVRVPLTKRVSALINNALDKIGYMLSPQLRQRIFSLWTSFWSSGMTNPIVAIEQITYLLFIQRLEELDKSRPEGKPSLYEPDHDNCRWSSIRAIEDPSEAHRQLSQIVFPWLRTLGKTIHERWGSRSEEGIEVAEYLEDAYFQLPREKTSTLRQALEAVDQIFATAGTRGANADLMGDVFEYLLDELNTSGKNGQFRTPRHIIRFMIELLDPEPTARVIDPAAGTGGFLTNSILHHRLRLTAPEQLRLEWDGTPHRLAEIDRIFDRDLFTGYDNDRTMVRIGWMNLILHGIPNPRFMQKDPLSRSLSLEESDAYDYAFANPPYSGTVDKEDLHPKRFPRKSERSKEPITDRTDLLFIWLMLDLLKSKGRAAVIVPEGLLFGSTGAHRELRRELLFKHHIEGVISLPPGVFQPYTGVKTSILLFQKGDGTESDEPLTRQVWFYEISSDGYTLGANRVPQPTEPNDLWDALEKWKFREQAASLKANEHDYYQPHIYLERWRMVDKDFIDLPLDKRGELGQVLAIDEIFPGLFADGNTDREALLRKAESVAIASVQLAMLRLLKQIIVQQPYARKDLFDIQTITPEQRGQAISRLRTSLISSAIGILEKREGAGSFAEEHGRTLLNRAIGLLDEQISKADEKTGRPLLESISDSTRGEDDTTQGILGQELPLGILLTFARLDGYDIYLRTLDVYRQENKLPDSKCWTVPVREWRKRPEWKSEDGSVSGSHDEQGGVRPEYIAAAYDLKTGSYKAEFLDVDCIEANDFNLSASRYKPETSRGAVGTTASATDLIREIIQMDTEVQARLERLLLMVEERS